ncbi:FliI/YscN family ATPase [Phycisphaeraceae bacterium D3-23]
MTLLADQLGLIDDAVAVEVSGAVAEVRGLSARVTALPVPIGTHVTIATRRGRGPTLDGEVVGFAGNQAVVMALGPLTGVGPGDRVTAGQHAQQVRVGSSLLGRVLDGMGRPIDGQGPLRDTVPRPLNPKPVDPLTRPLIDEPLATGVRAVDGMTTLGKGQRLGVFAGPGCGKSTLLGMMAKQTEADVSVIALVGERGREVRDFIDNVLGPEGLARSVVVCATGDEPALLRVRAALVATSIAEHFRDSGLDTLLLVDSVTRLCQAQRQIGLAAGEPPATRGYPPSVFSLLPELMERSGRTPAGSITALYAVLVEGDDLTEPIADACMGVLDGHVLLSRKLADRGHFPAIDVLGSISRIAPDVTPPEHQHARREVLQLLAAYRDVEDLLNIGAYAAGSNPQFDLAIAAKPMLDQFLQQGRGETTSAGNTRADLQHTQQQLAAIVMSLQQAGAQLGR